MAITGDNLSQEEIAALFAGSGQAPGDGDAPPAPDPAPRTAAADRQNIELILDVSLEVTVELGRTRREIREVLALGPGSVVELDRLAGEPVDVLVNGKLVARGEVVVIGENFGVRITDVAPALARVMGG